MCKNSILHSATTGALLPGRKQEGGSVFKKYIFLLSLQPSNVTYSHFTHSRMKWDHGLTLRAESLEFGDFCNGLKGGVGQMRRVQEGEGAQRRTPGDQTLLRKTRFEPCVLRSTEIYCDLLWSIVINCVLRLEDQTCMKIYCVLWGCERITLSFKCSLSGVWCGWGRGKDLEESNGSWWE